MASTSKQNQPHVPFKTLGRFAGQRRKRPENDSDEEKNSAASSDDETSVVRPEKLRRANPLIQSTGVIKSRPAKYASSSGSESEHDANNDPIEAPSKLAQSYEASKSGEKLLPRDMGATATNEIDTDFDHDAQALFMKNLEHSKDWQKKVDDKIYHGLNAYTNFVEVKDRPSGNVTSGMVRQGPIRAPNNIRQTILFDYRPDICKDYRETGFCCFGDSCKFSHDRSDYKHGWEIEREWEQGRYAKQQEKNYEVSDEDEEKLPFRCLICRGSFKIPIVTKCKHYFCLQCAVDRFRTTHRCFACGVETHGVFNPAKELIAKLKGEKLRGEKEQQSSDDEEKEAEIVTEMEIPTKE